MSNQQLKQHSRIDILMAAYNGEKYIAEQIDSILNQTVDDFRLVIQDDCSTDNTVKIIQDYVNQDHRVVLIQNNTNLGYVKNFEKLILQSNSDYIFLSDQDDVWQKNKLELLLDMLNNDSSNLNPILVYSDLKVVDNNLNPVADSLWSMLDLTPFRGVINYQSNSSAYTNEPNILTGCSCGFKSSLKQYILPFSDKTPHDEQIFNQALLHGVDYTDTPLVYYRQHDSNVIGAAKSKFQLVYKTGFFTKKRIVKVIPVLENKKSYKFKIEIPENIRKFYIRPLNKANKVLIDFECKLNGMVLDIDKFINADLLADNKINIKSKDSRLVFNKIVHKGSTIEVNFGVN